MTVVVTFLCDDGVVVAADSMLTPSFGGISVGHHDCRKVHLLEDKQVFAYAGDSGLAARVRAIATSLEPTTDEPGALEYPLRVTRRAIEDFNATGLARDQIEINGVLAFHRDNAFQSCVFEGMFQPRLLDKDHYYAALGTGKLSADPFLRFLTGVFCLEGRPSVRQATLLATWVVHHVIETNPGGVAGPIQISTLEMKNGIVSARELNVETDIQEHMQAIQSAGDALRDWRDAMRSGEAADDAPAQPSLQPAP